MKIRPNVRILVLAALVVALAAPAASALPALTQGLKVVQVTRFGGGMFDGMMGGMIRRAGMPEEMEETVTVNEEATMKRTDQGRDRSSIIDLVAEEVIDLDHKKKKATRTPFAVLRERLRKASEAMANLQQSQSGGQPQGQQGEQADVQVTLETSVVSAGNVQHGQWPSEEFHQTLAFRSRNAQGEDLGAFVAYSILHVTDAFDRGPLDAFDRAYAQKMAEVLGETGGLGTAMAALLGDARIREALEEAGRGFEQIGDRANVFTKMAMVSVPPNVVFDPEKAFVKPEKKGGGLGAMFKAAAGGGNSDAPPTEQSTSLITEMDVRSAEWITLAADTFAIPARYEVKVERE